MIKRIINKFIDRCSIRACWRFVFPRFEKLEFDTVYNTLMSASSDQLENAYNFIEKQYFGEIDRRKTIDSRARSQISFLSLMVTLIFSAGVVASFKIDVISYKFAMTFVVFFASIVLSSWVVLLRSYMVPQQNNFFNKNVICHVHENTYLTYLAYEYYQCWIHNMTLDERKAKALQLAQLLFFVGVILLACTGYDIIFQLHSTTQPG